MSDAKPTSQKIDLSKETVLPLKGSELHHDLKDQPGEEGNPDHADFEQKDGKKVEKVIKDNLPKDEDDTPMAAAMNKAVKD